VLSDDVLVFIYRHVPVRLQLEHRCVSERFYRLLPRAVWELSVTLQKLQPVVSVFRDLRALQITAAEPMISASELGAAFLSCHTLNRLKWKGLSSDAVMEVLSQELPHCAILSQLDLHGNGVTASGVRSLSKALPKCSALTRLDLGRNGIGPEGATVLSEAVKQCPKLSELDVQGNATEAEGLCEMLPRLTRACLGWNGVGPEGMRLLSEPLRSCSALCQLDLQCRVLVGSRDAGQTTSWRQVESVSCDRRYHSAQP